MAASDGDEQMSDVDGPSSQRDVPQSFSRADQRDTDARSGQNSQLAHPQPVSTTSHGHPVLGTQLEGSTIEQQETQQGDDDRPFPTSRPQRQHHEIAAADDNCGPEEEDKIAAQKLRSPQVDMEDEHELKKIRSR
jgi:hypothetical protein